MKQISYFEEGQRCYLNQDYPASVTCFKQGVAEGSLSCKAWLAHCYENGLGVPQDFTIAKNLYKSCNAYLAYRLENLGQLGAWVRERLHALREVEDLTSYKCHLEGIGNVRVVNSPYAYQAPKVRYNQDEILVTIEARSPLIEGIILVEKHVPMWQQQWTCDGHSPYYDGYQLKTDYFHLQVMRGSNERYVSRLTDHQCTLLFPHSACLDYLYVQKAIHAKVKDLLYKRAQQVLPQVLQSVSERLQVPYGKCKVVKACRTYWAINYAPSHDISMSYACIQLPQRSVEAICIHELTHNFVRGHGKDFYAKMVELGGEEVLRINKNLGKEPQWSSLLL